MTKIRIDLLLVNRGLAPSRARAQGLIMSGNVLVSDVPVTKPGHLVAEDAPIRVRGQDHPYVSRGGIKLAEALDRFCVDAAGKVSLDIGASTGGFTEVLLIRGAVRVHAVDVGHNQMDWKIRQDPRVRVLERVNARSLASDQIGELVDIVVIDVSFISLDKILAPVMKIAKEGADWITLIKPQFEVGREFVGKGGIVTDIRATQNAIERLTSHAQSLGLDRMGLIDSPITGTDGNQEYLAHWKSVARRLQP